ncbi:hypothetical protein [Mongoliimonas terrestris]|uniref:hypothetical protein n=1 Tax=Mongoliimonas terrestris TaxID=1709001 RepID=UPI0009498C08|nr:hypothetical protein [Mongoliimonas terrestris]
MRTLKTSAFALSVLMLSSAAFAQTTPGATTTNPSETETDAGIIESITPSNQPPQTGGTTGATGATGAAGTMDNSAGAAPENTNPSESEQGASRLQELQQNCPEGQTRANVGAECMPQ